MQTAHLKELNSQVKSWSILKARSNMEKSKTHLRKWYGLLGGCISVATLVWLISTPSLSDRQLLLSFSSQRLVMIGSIFVLGFLFLLLFVLVNKPQTLTLFNHLMGSSWAFLFNILFSITSSAVLVVFFLNLAGKRSILLERLLPLFVFVLLISLETLLFQIVFSNGKIKLPALFVRIQPILCEEDYSRAPTKKVYVIYSVLILLPIFVTIILVRMNGYQLQDFHPAEIDEIVYQQEVSTFVTHTFRGGYFSIDELVAKSRFSPFGAHGPAFAVFLGGLGKLFGWQGNSAPYYNLVILAFSLAGFVLLVKPNVKQTIFCILIIGCYWPLIYYIPSIMQETLHFSLAILFSALIIHLSRGQDNSRKLVSIFAILLLVFATSLRFTWAICSFPVFYLIQKNRGLKSVLLSLLAGGLFSIGMLVLYSWWTSPYQVGFLYNFVNEDSLFGRLILLKDHFFENINLFFRTIQITKLEIFFHFQFLVILLLYLFNRNKKNILASANLFILVSSLLVNLLFYDFFDLRDFRNLSPFLLISALSLGFFNYRGIFKLVQPAYLLSCLLAAGFFYQLYTNNIRTHFSQDIYVMDEKFLSSIEALEWQQKDSKWCNALLASYPLFNEVRLLPSGIGINIMLTDPEDLFVKSRYVYVSRKIFEKNASLASCVLVAEDTERVFCLQPNPLCD